MDEKTDNSDRNCEKIIVDHPGKVTSVVWKHFGFLKLKNEDGVPFISKEKAVCKICKFETNYNTNTTNLSAHLKSKHSEVLASKPKSTQATIQQHFRGISKMPKSSEGSKQITRAIAEYVVDDICPLSTIASSIS